MKNVFLSTQKCFEADALSLRGPSLSWAEQSGWQPPMGSMEESYVGWVGSVWTTEEVVTEHDEPQHP